MNESVAIMTLDRAFVRRMQESRDLRDFFSGRRRRELKKKWARARRPRYVYHGSPAGADCRLSDIVEEGLVARGDRTGNSVSVDPKRAKLWGWLRSNVEPYVLRFEAKGLKKWTPDVDARPALPDVDFITDSVVQPWLIDVKIGRRWVPLLKLWDGVLREDEFSVNDPSFEWGAWASRQDIWPDDALRILERAGVEVDLELFEEAYEESDEQMGLV